MNNIVVLTLPLALVVTAVMVLLHIACAVISARRENIATRIVLIALSVINAAAHLVLIAYAVFKDIPTEELLCLLMLSAAVGMVSIGISERRKRGKEDV